jgi:hypothetical protein
VRQKENLEDFYSILINNETLLRLLYYHPENYLDDPLDPNKDDVTTLSNTWDIRRNLIKKSRAVKDITSETEINRVLIYAGKRRPTRNYLIADQRIVIDHFTRIKDDEMDFRQSKINDKINDLFTNNKISGIGKVEFLDGNQIGAPAEGFVGYRLIFEIGSVN